VIIINDQEKGIEAEISPDLEKLLDELSDMEEYDLFKNTAVSKSSTSSIPEGLPASLKPLPSERPEKI
jgi:hypothetical protein